MNGKTKDRRFTAGMVECLSESVMIRIDADLGKQVEEAQITNSPVYLLEGLQDRMKKLSERFSPIILDLVTRGLNQMSPNLMIGQDTAVSVSLSQPITFIWGPPGTGKTYTLAKIAKKCIRNRLKVLMVSYSNVAVDGVVLRLNQMLDEKDRIPGKVLRFGYPRDEQLLEHEHLWVHNYLLKTHPLLYSEETKLQAAKKKADPNSEEYFRITDRLSKIRKNLEEFEHTACRNCSFAATTIAKAVSDKKFYEGYFDVVIVDEASMAYIPQVVFGASLAKSHFVCMGDFMQLPPIVQSKDNEFLKKDIFELAGITQAVNSNSSSSTCGHNWLVMLNEQYRYAQDISNFVSSFMYRNLLKTTGEAISNTRSIMKSSPFPGKAIQLVDTGALKTEAVSLEEGSRINLISAFLSVALALEYSSNWSVAIITPYRAQVKLINAVLRDLEEQCGYLTNVSCSTVHQFQGSERDIVIYDPVEAGFSRKPGKMLKNNENKSADRLFNVAMTRSRGKFIFLGDLDYFKRNGFDNTLMMSLLNRNRTGAVSIESIRFQSNSVWSDAFSFLNEDEYFNELVQLLKESRDILLNLVHIKMFSATAHIFKDRSEVLNIGEAMNLEVRTESFSSLPDPLVDYSHRSKWPTETLIISDNLLLLPLKQSEDVHSGSQEIYAVKLIGRRTCSCIEELKDKKTGAVGFYDLEFDDNGHPIIRSFEDYVQHACLCGQCSSPMKLTRNYETGSLYLKCSKPSCDETKYIDESLINHYLYYQYDRGGFRCPKCGSTTHIERKPNQIMICCDNEHSHRYDLLDL